jgi:hypothetical protein
MVEWLTFLLRIREVLCSNLGLETGYSEVFRGFPQYLQANAGIEPMLLLVRSQYEGHIYFERNMGSR